MKKILLVIFVVVLTFVLVGCNKEEVNNIQTDEITEFTTNLDDVYNAIIYEQPEDKREELILFK